MVHEDRIQKVFFELVSFDSESFKEKHIGENIAGRLRDLGLEVTTYTGTDEQFLEAHPESFPNIYGLLKGNVPGEPVLFAAHLDTVAPGKGKRAVTDAEGTIRSAGDTVLGADDLSGIVAILEALTVIRETGKEHPDIEVLITTAEEPFCEGSRYFDYSLIRSRAAYVLDLTGPIGTAAIAAPTILSFTAEIRGKAAHGGFAPEKGINALTITAETLAEIPTGRVDAVSTVNIGITTEVEDKFSFLHKTSTEEGDILQFWMNGKEVETWSGISDWEKAEVDLPAGTNLIRFTFKKNTEGSDGEDAVMVDHLCFPPFANMVLFAGNDTETCSNASFTPEGYIYNHSEFAWSTNGDGTFDDSTLEHPTYTFGPTDITEGQVELTLTGTAALNGSQQSSTVAVSLIPSFEPSYSPETPNGATEVDLRLVSESDFEGENISEVIYIWSLEPETAGTITSEGHRAKVQWSGEYRGQAKVSYRYENPCGSTAVSEALAVNVFNSTAIDEQDATLFNIYPNPTNGKVNLTINEKQQGNAVVEVYNLLGERMMAKSISHLQERETLTLDLGHLVSGLYIIKLSGAIGSCSKKVSVR